MAPFTLYWITFHTGLIFSLMEIFVGVYTMVVAKGDAREVGDRELEIFQICQSTSLPGQQVNFLDDEINKINPTLMVTKP